MSRVRLEAGCEPIPGLKLVQLRGRGGFAVVWEAVDRKGARSAVKFMASRNAASSVKEMRIIQAIQRLYHKNLLRVDNVWSIPDYIVVAMELADGSLLDLLDVWHEEYRAHLPANLIVGYLKQAAGALDFLNAREHTFDGRTVGFQHCDVKPSNLLLVGETVKLADFGLCTATAGFQANYGRAGTLDFAAPEIHRGDLADQSDQYSLAVTYFYLRTGMFPFPTPPAGFQREYSYNRPAPDLTRVSRAERFVLEKALDIEPTGRWSSCTALVLALEEAVNHPERVPNTSSALLRRPVIVPAARN
ncbi:MAG: protein kinase [Zavarzinella sp.]|nr:protein kinase [Zavarzinella sp.]